MAIIWKVKYDKFKNLSVNEVEFLYTLLGEISNGYVPMDKLKTQYDYSKIYYEAIAFNIYSKLAGVVKKQVVEYGK